MPRYDLATTKVGTLLDDPDAVAVVERHYPGVAGNPALKFVRGMMAAKAVNLASSYVSEQEIATIRAELEAL